MAHGFQSCYLDGYVFFFNLQWCESVYSTPQWSFFKEDHGIGSCYGDVSYMVIHEVDLVVSLTKGPAIIILKRGYVCVFSPKEHTDTHKQQRKRERENFQNDACSGTSTAFCVCLCVYLSFLSAFLIYLVQYRILNHLFFLSLSTPTNLSLLSGIISMSLSVFSAWRNSFPTGASNMLHTHT